MKLVTCVVGDSFDNNFLTSWTKLIKHLMLRGWEIHNRHVTGSNIYHLRELIVSEALRKGETPKIFDNLEYDYVLWVDSDQVFEPVHFEMLLEDMKEVDVVSGSIKTLPHMKYAFRTSTVYEDQITDLTDMPRLLEVQTLGFGFLLMKKGVFEKMRDAGEYPFFKPEENDTIAYFGEDFSWCIKARRAGIKLYADTKCRIGHSKTVVI